MASIPYDGSSTWATRGTGSSVGVVKYITDIGDEGSYFRWNGTYWRVLAPTDVYFNTTTVTGDTTGNDQILKQALIPAGLLRAGRCFDIFGIFGKSGTTDAATTNRVRIGTAGTVADTVLLTYNNMTAANRTYAHSNRFMLSTATQVTLVSSQNDDVAPYPNASTTVAYPVQTTIPDVDTNALYISQSFDMAGLTDAPQGFVLGVTIYP